MPTITFNAFSFLRRKLEKRNIECSNVRMEIDPEMTAADVVQKVGLNLEEVEVAIINGKVSPLSAPVNDNDRVALVPPGTPGPYRVLLGFKNKKNR